MKKNPLRHLVRVATGLGLLALFVARIGWRQVWSDLVSADYRWVLVALAMYGLGVLVRALRWQVLLRSLGNRVSIWRLSALSFVGFFFNTFLPTGYGGDVVRAIEAARDVPGSVAVSSLVADRAIGLLSVCLLALAAWPFSLREGDPSLQVIGSVAGAVAAGLTLALWLLTQTGFARWAMQRLPFLTSRPPWLTGLANTLQDYSRRSLAQSLAYALVFGFTNALTYAFIGQAVGVEVPLSYYLLVSPLITLALLIPLAFNGIGTRDAAYLLFFTPIGVPAALALAMSVIYHALNLLAGLMGGGVYLAMAATHSTQGVPCAKP